MPPVHQQLVRTTRSPAETRSLGRSLARCLGQGDLLCLRGELGAGKTTFVQGLVQGLGLPDPATSPSFTILHHHPGPLPLYHVDLYRLGPADLPDLGLDEILTSAAVIAVEWAERLPPGLQQDALDIEITFDDEAEDLRTFRLSPRGPRARRILSCLAEQADARPRT